MSISVRGVLAKSNAELVERARALAPEAVEAQRRKLLEALEALGQTPDPQRVEQEVALVAQRLDVAEELDRLSSHLQELERTLTRGGSVGKRLDFLLQEFNREANTLASKAGSLAHVKENRACVDIALTAIDLQELDSAFPAPRKKQSLAML